VEEIWDSPVTMDTRAGVALDEESNSMFIDAEAITRNYAANGLYVSDAERPNVSLLE
jgi:hypothetical protein